MDGRNFSSEIHLYLNTELALCAGLTAKHAYDCIVEFGCGRLRMLGVSMANDAGYLGIDVRRQSSLENKIFISSNELHGCRFIRARAERFASLASHLFMQNEASSEPYHGLIVLPFNFIGNLHDVKVFLDNITSSGQDILISQFSINERATRIRSDYYTSCGLDPKYNHDQLGCIFWSKAGFSSRSYYLSYMDSLMEARGYQRDTQTISCIHSICHYRHAATDNSIIPPGQDR